MDQAESKQRYPNHLFTVILCLFVMVLSSCGWDNQAPEEAALLWQQLQRADYRSWQPVKGFATPQLAQQPYDNPFDARPLKVTIYMNQVAQQAASSGKSQRTWPTGSVFVKDGFQGEDHRAVVVMEKRKDGWFYAQWEPDGTATHSGAPDGCVSCHTKASDSDYTFTIGPSGP